MNIFLSCCNIFCFILRCLFPADRTVQYRFCVPIIPERLCDPGDLAITMATSTQSWNPFIREARCACPESTYQLLGWWRHPTSQHDNRTGQWIYEYSCEKVFQTKLHDYFILLLSATLHYSYKHNLRLWCRIIETTLCHETNYNSFAPSPQTICTY